MYDLLRHREVGTLPVTMVVAVLALLLGLVSAPLSSPTPMYAPVAVTVSAAAQGRTIPAGFLGLSLEYPAIESYAGSDPSAISPLFLRLVRTVTGTHPVLRIGGDSADSTWWPASTITKPPGVNFSLDHRWLAVTRAMTTTLGARLVLGLNLEANDPSLAAGEQQALLAGLGRSPIIAFELGNEPSLYGTFPWYRAAGGRGVSGRPHDYRFPQYLADFTRFAATLATFPLAGPTSGGLGWLPRLSEYLAAAPAVRVVTMHRYPLQLCVTARRSPRYPTISHLLSDAASVGLAHEFAAAVAVARAHGLPLRFDELNSVSCGNVPAVSHSFASALWAPDLLFALANIGVTGVNIHTFPGAGYELFTLHLGTPETAQVFPEYYGLMLFAAAAPAGSRLLSASPTGAPGVRAWATAGPDRRIRVLVINKRPGLSRPVRLRIAGASTGAIATVQLMQAPSLQSQSGVTLGGRSFGTSTSTGTLTGASQAATVSPRGGVYTVTMPGATAAVLTVPTP